ncbi:MAG: dUTP diphosphatase [Firmicutes bacterium]|nr:dUTP diphosphatase [Bacillota bacterium]
MKEVTVRIRRLPAAADLPLPRYMTGGAAGMDLYAAVTEPVVLAPGEYRAIPCGIALALPPGYEAQVRPRSGLAREFGVTLLNAPGTVDADYRGEIQAVLVNHGSRPFTVRRGDRIAQLVVQEVVRVRWEEVGALEATSRGEGGFGHTGR